MAKKYLSLDEAAQLLGVTPENVNRMREKGDLRGFADRGNWKFRSEDIEEARRRRQVDSDPDVNLLPEEGSYSLFDDEQPASRKGNANSDSDVRLIAPASKSRDEARTDPDISLANLPMSPSDSDVRLASKPGSDSDVKLVSNANSDSDVRLALSDSDVKLAKNTGSDSDVRLVGGLDAKRPGSDSDVALVGDIGTDRDYGGSAILDDDDPVFLSGESALRLGGDSGIDLGRPADSGILLERPKSGGSGFFGGKTEPDQFTLAMDSTPKLGDSSKSKAKPAQDDLDMTVPMLAMDDDGEAETVTTTAFEVPLMDDSSPKRKSAAQTEGDILLFDEDDEFDNAQPTMIRKGSGNMADDDDEFADLSDSSVAELDAEDDVVEFDDADDDDDDSVFADADEDDMDGSFAEGASAVGMSGGGIRSRVPVEKEWGAGTFSLLAVSTLTLAAGCVVAADLMRVIWSQGQTAVYSGALVELIGGFFK